MPVGFEALGIAANIVQFVEFGFKISISVIETYRSITEDGILPQTAELEEMARSLERSCRQLQADVKIQDDAEMSSLLEICVKGSQDLLREVGELVIGNNNRRPRWMKKVKVTMKARRKQRKINEIQHNLNDIKKKIFEKLQHILHDYCRSTSEYLYSLGDASAAWNTATDAKLAKLSEDVGMLIKSTAPLTNELEELATNLKKLAEQVKHQGKIREILKSLRFPEMIERRIEIPKAYGDTFEWIFEESADVNFASWLQSSRGIFWVTGKPGSGKSTLMKLISGHEHTAALARAWADEKKLIVASHFFWGIRSGLQSSQEGLLRALLFQIMMQCPDIIHDVFPERYEGSIADLDPWTIEDLSNGFKRLGAMQSLKYRILIFIDGLDEYKGEPEDLMKFLKDVAQSPDIKICCASRPWPVFTKYLGNSSTRIHMDQLTADDMAAYVRDALGQHQHYQSLLRSHESEAIELIESILRKSEGVFFWVSLVIKSLLRGMENDDDIGTLRERLSELPSDLDKYFRRMLSSIDRVYRDAVSVTFSMLLVADTAIPAVCFLSFDTYMKEMRLKHSDAGAQRQTRTMGSRTRPPLRESWTLPFLQINHQQDREADARSESGCITGRSLVQLQSQEIDDSPEFAQKVLRKKENVLAQCCDLIQSWEVDGTPTFGSRIGFLHRTVVEFLQQSSGDQWRSPLEHQRFWLAKSYLEVGFSNASPGVKKDFTFRSLRTIEEADTHDIEESGAWLLDLCEYIWLGDANIIIVEGLREVASQIWARIFLSLKSEESDFAKPDALVHLALHSIMTGSVHIGASDPPEVVSTQSVDLQLLRNFLRWMGTENYEDILSVQFKAFIVRLSQNDSSSTQLKNAFQVCKLLIEHGAVIHSIPRHLSAIGDGNQTEATAKDTMERLRLLDYFTEEELSNLEKSFPPDGRNTGENEQTSMENNSSEIFMWHAFFMTLL
ncbi:uncharacterized protein CLUP02_15596 [Colletotrichum lupini]|uniref:Nephrocystin 3-like N-terminal domain-containing protein n=1 Tax=Colletotrichum lupini TaxID=145971 RepID=A0A9Q8WPD3_9PEZI|nr:uncharacterized protein CLUP02_15596 [Colletotrichum lupini]UQC90065.1 hypothetical protein CLUP02_15596 [Colletotrichum lupini]